MPLASWHLLERYDCVPTKGHSSILSEETAVHKTSNRIKEWRKKPGIGLSCATIAQRSSSCQEWYKPINTNLLLAKTIKYLSYVNSVNV